MSTDMKTKTKSPWILHVLAYSKANNLKYNEALRDPGLKVGYVKVERSKKSKSSPKSEQMEMKYSSMNVESPKVKKSKSSPKSEKMEMKYSPMKVKKTRKMKEHMVEHMVEPQMFIQSESGNLQQIPEAPLKKVRVKKDKKM